ncbi:MAG: sensor histidine kinase KdpD [Pirellulales bacterium]|nr:sensor histidine kinase KdpD [Pirellulales bacterium]
MDASRPDPDALLARVQAEEARHHRGKLKIFFGAAPGVGKTYSMLEAGRKFAKEGMDVVVGYVEPHARPETQALVLGLDVLARLEVNHRGAKLLEFDLNAALARRPQLILVDELAHTNAPGVTHTKRWQDVLQLLDAGIDVYTTLNVQHLESLNDVVAQITGVVVRETVPDSIFEQADEVEVVDLAPDDLLERLREGKVYIPRQAERAIQNFFAKGNLIALRELALRKAAERVGAQMEDYREQHGVVGTWPARERLLVCVGPSPFATRLVRATRRMAVGLKAPWVAVHIQTPDDARMPEVDRNQLAETLRLVEQLGGETATLTGDDLVEELLHYARSRNVTKIIVGKPKRPRWREWLSGSLVYELTRRSGDIDLYVTSGDPAPAPVPAAGTPVPAGQSAAYLWAVLVVFLCTTLGSFLSHFFAAVNLIMVYLLGVLGIAVRFGRGPSILASVLSVAAFDFFFVPPHLTFAVRDTQYVFTFAVMLLTAIVISTLTARVKFQAESARAREHRTASLYAMSRELAATQGREQIARVAVRHAAEAAETRVVVLLPDPQRRLVPLGTDVSGFVPGPNDEAVANWVLEHGQAAGRAAPTLPGAEGFYLPLMASHGTIGVLGVAPNGTQPATAPEQLHLLETLARLIALALERAELVAEAERIRLQMETEQLRSSLLSAVSHDLRTPLSVITGAGSTLLEQDDSLDPQVRRELLASVLDEAERLNRLVANLLDMTRLEAGALQVRKQWQSMEEIIGAALGRVSRQLKDHSVITRLAPDLPFVLMDDLLIQQVLVNLLENAAKYAPHGSPIEVQADADDQSLTVSVADAGPGLPPGDLERVFEKFYRGGDPRARPGAGLGLAICRGIVELHGGRIRAENRSVGGAIVRFSLPLAAGPEPVPIAEPAT